jgi:hypothetical protein
MFYIGDLSSPDAAVLADAAHAASSILEFGVGGSTQIFAQSAPEHAQLVSLDTSHEWIVRTMAILEAMDLRDRVLFQRYGDWVVESELTPGGATFDLLFDDGIDTLRLDFANRAWPTLKVGGKLIFHDTRRPRDYMNVLQFAAVHYLEIGAIQANVNASNLTVITKQHVHAYENWNTSEGRSPVMVGCASIHETIVFVGDSLRAKQPADRMASTL